MRNETLQKGLLALTAAFPNITFNARLYQEALNDLPDEFFLAAVMDFIKTVRELFPGSNPIAILRENALELERVTRSRRVKKIAQETQEEERKRFEKDRESPEYKKAYAEFKAAFKTAVHKTNVPHETPKQEKLNV